MPLILNPGQKTGEVEKVQGEDHMREEGRRPEPGQENTERLCVRDLSVTYEDESEAVVRVSFAVQAGESVGIIGESGSGKSTLLRAVAGILKPKAAVKGEILFEGRSLLRMGTADRRSLMGEEISMIFQNPVGSLDPVKRVGKQMKELYRLHGFTGKQAEERAVQLLSSLHFEDPKAVLAAYPFELSGGMCQRVCVAMAASCRDLKLILADEPTSALDRPVRRSTAGLIRTVQENTGAALLFVTHDMDLVRQLAQKVGVMYRGMLVEWGTAGEILEDARHPYTRSLLDAVPEKDTDFRAFRRYTGPAGSKREQLSKTHWVLRQCPAWHE